MVIFSDKLLKISFLIIKEQENYTSNSNHAQKPRTYTNKNRKDIKHLLLSFLKIQNYFILSKSVTNILS
jgi:hypothetical protein